MNIDPIAFHIGSIPIYWYGIIVSSAFLLGFILAFKRAHLYGIDEDNLTNFFFILLPLVLVGARTYYVVMNWDFYQGDFLRIINVRSGGLAIHGGVLVGLAFLILYWKAKKINIWSVGDLLAPGVALGEAIGRWGNFFNQEAYGYETDLPWAMFIAGAYRHPTFLYAVIWNSLVFTFLIYYEKKGLSKRRGEIMLHYFILYSVGRFFIEGLRTDSLMLGQFRVAQIVSILMIIIGTSLVYWRRKIMPPELEN